MQISVHTCSTTHDKPYFASVATQLCVELENCDEIGTFHCQCELFTFHAYLSLFFPSSLYCVHQMTAWTRRTLTSVHISLSSPTLPAYGNDPAMLGSSRQAHTHAHTHTHTPSQTRTCTAGEIGTRQNEKKMAHVQFRLLHTHTHTHTHTPVDQCEIKTRVAIKTQTPAVDRRPRRVPRGHPGGPVSCSGPQIVCSRHYDGHLIGSFTWD